MTVTVERVSLWTVLAVVVFLSLGLAACGPTPTPVPPTDTLTPVPPTDTPTPVPPTDTPTPLPPTDTPTPISLRPTQIPTLTLTLTPTPKPVAVVQAEALNVRSGPGTEYDVIGQVKQGNELVIVARTEEGDWLQMRLANGKEGWVSMQLVKVDGEATGIPVVAVVPPTPTPMPTVPLPTDTATPSPTSVTSVALGPCCEPLQPGKAMLWFETFGSVGGVVTMGTDRYGIPGRQFEAGEAGPTGCLCLQVDPGSHEITVADRWSSPRWETKLWMDIVAGQIWHLPMVGAAGRNETVGAKVEPYLLSQ